MSLQWENMDGRFSHLINPLRMLIFLMKAILSKDHLTAQ
ncbi:hypothetical protein AM1_F0121 (plasmid) [Acaryochloris marina MBIC11017]|uniref:Uncharacterized protein n=1 Tax=Acaryochloris marina (strain MBIC 11017) TaxID=329726 RepID=A8ZPR4_ACAM1|nr:hypothetical protein AM1_F0121 [Acaryochloris marina MBIC11017]